MDHRIRVTHTLVKEALYKIIQTKPVQEITVKELCFEANINRTTFYAHFQSVQDLIAYCARVSNPSNQFNTMTADKLIDYLAKHQHWSPFSCATICLELETTRDISRQFLRHWSLAQGAQEYSQRYANPLVDLDFVIREARLQDTTNRQSSIELDMTNDSHRKLAYQWENYQKQQRQ